MVLIVWDDWGGFYDDVLPWNCQTGPNGGCLGYDSGGSGAQYVYGFRVPLLVVSAWTPTGYISGSCKTGPCTPQVPYVHDFGSILNFIEYTFGLSQGGIYPAYRYADFYAPDSPTGGCPGCTYSLSDFFNFGQTARTFVPITGAKYLTSCFFPNPSTCFGTNYPADPDDDEIDPQ